MDSDGSGTINIKELIDFLTAVGGEIDKDEVTEIKIWVGGILDQGDFPQLG